MAAVLVRLKKAGRRVALISLAEEPPPFLDSILAYHIPPDTPLFEEQAGQQAQATLATGKRAETEASLATIPAPEAMRQDEE
jgi:hypothetical protein